ncbi:GNAT family acetyltransferase [Actinorhabdospora filicis]|uniref:GNAT family acetyltransferase n=1 Tax=Actinorhabdospora filicis TaxID=1785913 RepID=A0A9W6SQF0_9ACTN|nr:GNAT family N-acetyltransferase [Actinorhabdospora filicis]GLZ78851.1 GNAT family acetyltransferase [Actinorhabdospora filicis]
MTEIRTAVHDDVPGLVECSIGLFSEDAGTRDPTMNLDWPRTNAAQSLTEGIGDPERLILAAIRDGRVVGSLTGDVAQASHMRPIRLATLRSMYVRPEARDGGVGSALVEAFRAWALDKKADRLAVTAYAANDDAIRFYRRNGFAPHHLVLEAQVEAT